MAVIKWRGDAPIVAQTGVLTIGGTVEVGDLFNVTINGKTLSYEATDTDEIVCCTELVAALEASTNPEFVEITWTDNEDGSLTYTGPDDGSPIVLTVETTEAGGGTADSQTFTDTPGDSASSPNHWSIAANWSSNTVPVNSDDVYIEDNDVDIKFGLDQSAVTLTSLNIAQSYTGNIGLPERNTDGSDSYYEYRDQFLTIKSTTTNIGYGVGSGSSMINLNNSTVQTTLNIQGSGSSDSRNRPTILWKGTHASNVVNLSKGEFGAAFLPGEVATILTLRIGYKDSIKSDVQAFIGSGTTLGTVEKSGGDLFMNAGCTTITQTDGATYVDSGAITTANIQGGDFYYNSTGTLTTANITGNGLLDFSKDMRAKTVTNRVNIYGNLSRFNDPFKVVGSLVLDLEQRNTLDGLVVGTNLSLTRGSVA
jgi:hypothetical protein